MLAVHLSKRVHCSCNGLMQVRQKYCPLPSLQPWVWVMVTCPVPLHPFHGRIDILLLVRSVHANEIKPSCSVS